MQMDARDYLGQLRELKYKITRDEDYLKEKRFKSIGLGSITEDANRVQSSPSFHGTENKIIECIELEKKLEAEIVKYTLLWQEIVTTIHMLDNPNYSRVLYLRWVKGEQMQNIARELHYHQKSISRIHRLAIMELQKILDEK